jgi:serine/arginine repetitive matrix protein 1
MRVGTSQDQDIRFSDKTKKLLKTVNFPKILSEKVDISKVNLDVLRPWIAKRVTELLGFEDEICIEFVYHLLVDEVDQIDVARSKTNSNQIDGILRRINV